MNLLRFDDGPSVAQALLSGPDRRHGRRRLRRDLSPKGRQGRGVRAEIPAAGGPFRHRHPPRKPRLLQWLNTFVYQIKNNGELDAISRKYRNDTPMIPLPVF